MQITMSLLTGRRIAEWLGSMGNTGVGGRGALVMIDDKVELGK
jgi:hypothetical protein